MNALSYEDMIGRKNIVLGNTTIRTLFLRSGKNVVPLSEDVHKVFADVEKFFFGDFCPCGTFHTDTLYVCHVCGSILQKSKPFYTTGKKRYFLLKEDKKSYFDNEGYHILSEKIVLFLDEKEQTVAIEDWSYHYIFTNHSEDDKAIINKLTNETYHFSDFLRHLLTKHKASFPFIFFDNNVQKVPTYIHHKMFKLEDLENISTILKEDISNYVQKVKEHRYHEFMYKPYRIIEYTILNFKNTKIELTPIRKSQDAFHKLLTTTTIENIEPLQLDKSLLIEYLVAMSESSSQTETILFYALLQNKKAITTYNEEQIEVLLLFMKEIKKTKEFVNYISNIVNLVKLHSYDEIYNYFSYLVDYEGFTNIESAKDYYLTVYLAKKKIPTKNLLPKDIKLKK